MTLDSTFVPLAESLINEFGKVVIFTSKPKTGEFDRKTGKLVAPTFETYTAKIAPPENYTHSFIDGDLIRVGDQKTIVSNQGNSFVPDVGWAITLDSTVWKIVKTNALYSGELIAAWELQLRQ